MAEKNLETYLSEQDMEYQKKSAKIEKRKESYPIIVKIAPALADNLSRQAQVLFEEFKKKVFKFPV